METVLPRCDGCGKEAYRNSETSSFVPLKRCSRCRKASYHNRSCQKMHYRVHSKTCGRSADVSIQELPGRGKGVVASRSLQPRECLSTEGRCLPLGGGASIPPLVLPVLHQQCRLSHCVVCFGRLGNSAVVLWDHPICPIRTCSEACRGTGEKEWFLSEELECLQYLYNHSGPPKLLPTALLIFRVFMALSKGKFQRDQIWCMKYHETKLSEDEAAHQQAVVATVMALLTSTQRTLGGAVTDNVDDLISLLQIVKYNAFTIVDHKDGDTSLGVGIFQSPAHCINHSCQPNATQSFDFTASIPRLQIVIHQPISVGEEICIRYQDDVGNDGSRDKRRKYLHEHYNFWCQCELCQKEG